METDAQAVPLPSFEQAAQAAFKDLQPSEEPVTDTQPEEPDQAEATETEEPKETEPEEAPEEERFTDVDPDALDPKEALRQMQKDYTRKTQAVADERRELEALRETYLSRIAEVQELAKGQSQTKDEPVQPAKMSGEELLLEILDKGESALDSRVEARAMEMLKQALAEQIAPLQAAESQRSTAAQETSFAETYPHLNVPEYRDQIADLMEKGRSFPESVEVVDGRWAKAQLGTIRTEQKRSAAATKTAAPSSSAPVQRPAAYKSFAEAADAAMREHGV